MLNTNNYFSKAASSNWDNLPEALSKGHKLVEGASQNNWAAYNSNENIKRVVDAFFQKLNDYLDKNPSAVTSVSKSLPSKAEKTAPKAAAPKPTPATRKMPPKKAAVEKEEYDSEDGERSMRSTVAAFNVLTGNILSEQEGWLFMLLLKIARQHQTPDWHQDSSEDAIAYAALMAEAWQNEEEDDIEIIFKFTPDDDE